jgi:hypothetical protein
LQKNEHNKRWKDEFGQNEIAFERDAAGKITGISIYTNLYLKKL